MNTNTAPFHFDFHRFDFHRPGQPAALKLVALGLLALPATGLLLLAVGEVAAGDISGLQHVPEAVMLVVCMALGWRHPRETGWVLLAAGSVLLAGGLWLNLSRDNFDQAGPTLLLWTAIFALLFAPPLLAGWLLLIAGRRLRRPPVD